MDQKRGWGPETIRDCRNEVIKKNSACVNSQWGDYEDLPDTRHEPMDKEMELAHQ